ncbi:S-layer family protein [Allocoleopsis sp.]|uniref:S-layer family protein n=1 Tax=Allocoleopsis sp. TaxID=3088169 RepID=UPI002FD015C0
MGCFFRQPRRRTLWLTGSLYICLLSFSSPGSSQIIPDNTLPNNTLVTPNGNTRIIEGGTQAGSNLFHSFQEFSVPTDSTAFFNNALDIQNIISRVTGSNISNIDGTLRANGTANLFLINPNGIMFGPTARLDIGGSLIGSTASSLKFSDGTEFSATRPSGIPLLAIAVPLGLQYGPNSGAIRVQGTGHTVTSSFFSPFVGAGSSNSGLRVNPGNTLALVGGDVTLEGGILTAPGGRIELGSVGEGFVSLTPPSPGGATGGWTLGYEAVQNFRDIQLLSQTLADASGVGSGSIQVQGRNLELRDGSVMLIQNQGVQAGGSINVNATETVTLIGTTPDASTRSGLFNETLGIAKGGDIRLSTQHLVMQGGAGILANTFGNAPSGNLSVNASDSIRLSGFSPINPNAVSEIRATTFSSGRAGNVAVSTGQLNAVDGGGISSLTFGTGNGGDVTVNAAESVEMTGVSPGILRPSSVSAATFNAGNAGSVTVNTSRLVLRDGGIVGSATFATGNATSLTINASESVEVGSTAPGVQFPSVVSSTTPILDEFTRQLFGVPDLPSGDSGDVTIKTPVLRVTNGGQVTVRNDGRGKPGMLRVNTSSLLLDNGTITATSISGQGGDIELQVKDDLVLRDRSQISTRAGTVNTGGGNGGNITIDTGVLAVLDNSSINANAFQGTGGNIRITTRGNFVSPDSSITASSTLGVNGVVEINKLVADPSQGLIELPDEVVGATGLVTTGCSVDTGSSFVVTGRGGLPEDPTQALRGQTVWRDLRPPRVVGRENIQGRGRDLPMTHPQSPLVEATGWVRNANGQVELVAHAPDVTPQNPWSRPTDCQTLNSRK